MGGSPSRQPRTQQMAALRRAAAAERAGPGLGYSSVQKNRLKREPRWTWLRIMLLVLGSICGAWLFDYLYNNNDLMEVFARQTEILDGKVVEVQCSEDYDSYQRFAGCTPVKCGRAVTDSVVNREEAEKMLSIARRGLSLGGSDGGASILDLHSGALSMGKQFVNIYRYFGEKVKELFTAEDFRLYSELRWRIQQRVADTFGIDPNVLHLTKPTFFSRMNSTEAKTMHDEYWHPHIDKVTYGSFDYTSLLYLSDYKADFGGGRFVFVDEHVNSTVEPRKGRISFFTSGSENLHYVEKVERGTRYAITVSFTCDPAHAVDDPTLP
eukprot:gi/632942882/ref/XP_007886667.1/ PREDICTED: 2-oxoglutarate and iron-dependent oxygenase domain-containing protein 3 [Callorhinchus milii]